jgi:predicted AAA+ superfamily ATPase
MAVTNQERVGKAMEFLRQGLAPFVQREFKSVGADPLRYVAEDRMNAKKAVTEWDAAALLKVLQDSWNEVFTKTLGRAERSLVQELRDWRNKWAHQEPFTGDDTDRALDSVARLLTAVSAPQADEVSKIKMELRRLIYDEQVRNEKKKVGGSLVEAASTGSLKPWREVVTPHADVAQGHYRQAEFAADLWQVHLGEGSDEYRKPDEFFRRTYLTESLKKLLITGVERIAGKGGDPVVQLQTNFGGGKTHSMLALYHLFSGAKLSDLSGIDSVLAEAGVKTLPVVKRVVLVGNKISPGNPVTKPDGTVVHTLWGELAYQLGKKKAYARIKADDEKATNPGDVLRELFNEYSPCLILIDEWVAYARQLHDKKDLIAGDFETMFTFAQTLTEAAKAAKNCLLVVSLPASDTTGSPHTQTDDVEVGGVRGREALDRLRNVVARVESSWRPATAEEGFEIVRRRLFEPLAGNDAFKQRDVTARAFSELYESQRAEFPPECRGADYEKRIKAAYPIHPEIFDRLYTDWSTLIKFQRTRGVLRLMAAVIHCLWEKGDKNPLILPSTIPIDDTRVQSELTRYLSDNWVPIIEKDVDGPDSLPRKIDAEIPNLGKLHATRRVARTIYLGSAPTSSAAHRGIEDRRVKLGCVMPGESPAVFGDATRRLAAAATYLYQDGARVWYSTQPTVTKLADDRAEQLKREIDKVTNEIDKRLRADLRTTGDFNRVHTMPPSGQDVPDDMDARLVLLGIDHSYSKESGNAAEAAAKAILETRGNTPRLFRNTLVFAAADKMRLEDLEEAVRRYLAWESILLEKDQLNLGPQQVKQAQSQHASADSAVTSRLPETYQWLLVPVQTSPQAAISWQATKVTGQGPLAVRACKKLRGDDMLATAFASTLLKMELDRVPLWRGEHVSIRQLVEDFARYLYLPRLADPGVLLSAIRSGVSLKSWKTDSFAYADSYDEGAARYRGLQCGQDIPLPDAEAPGLLVKAETALKQLDSEKAEAAPGDPQKPGKQPGGAGAPPSEQEKEDVTPQETKLKRFHGAVTLDPTRVGRDAGRIAEEVISHLSGLVGADVRVTLEIEADMPAGAPDNVVRTVTENSRTLKFTNHGFEKE